MAGLEELKRRLRPLSFDADGSGGAAPAGGEVRTPLVYSGVRRHCEMDWGTGGTAGLPSLKWRLLVTWCCRAAAAFAVGLLQLPVSTVKWEFG